MNETTELLLRGIVLGLSIAAPVGPIGVLCIRRTLSEGRAFGVASGLGAATADALYGAMAAFGLSFLATFLLSHEFWLRLIGGLFLCYLGLRTLSVRPANADPALGSAAARSVAGLGSAYATTLALTLTNPMTILSFVAIFAGLGLSAGSYLDAGLLVLGVFFGSALWWLMLSGGVSLIRGRVSAAGLRWINVISGLIVLGFGLLALIGSL